MCVCVCFCCLVSFLMPVTAFFLGVLSFLLLVCFLGFIIIIIIIIYIFSWMLPFFFFF